MVLPREDDALDVKPIQEQGQSHEILGWTQTHSTPKHQSLVLRDSFLHGNQFADISGRLCEVQEAAAEISAVSGWKIPLLTWKAPISHLHVQWWEAADVFFVNYFPCCICSVFLVILTRLFSLPVLSCLFLICAVWWVVVICVHPACCALGFADEAPCMQRLLAIKG